MGLGMERVRVGIIGTSGWTELMYMPALRSHPGVELTAVCSRSAESADAFAKKHGAGKSFTDYRRMLSEGGIDAVIVATPDDEHKQMVLDAAAAGLHILCEKPLANSAEDAGEMLAAAQRAGVVHMVLFTWRWQPHFQYLRKLLADGYAGRPYRAQFSLIGGWGREPTYQWRGDGSRSNGNLGDLGSHMIDLGLWLIGDIVSLTAHAPRLVDRSSFGGDPRPVNDTAHLILEFANGAQGVVDVSSLANLADTLVRFVVRIDGEDGSIEVEHMLFGGYDGVMVRGARRGEPALQDLAVPDSYYAGYNPKDTLGPYSHHAAGARLFVDAILGDFQPEPGFEAGVVAQRIVDAALQSHRERRWIDVR
jgi:predicted dehydrogenase